MLPIWGRIYLLSCWWFPTNTIHTNNMSSRTNRVIFGFKIKKKTLKNSAANFGHCHCHYNNVHSRKSTTLRAVVFFDHEKIIIITFSLLLFMNRSTHIIYEDAKLT